MARVARTRNRIAATAFPHHERVWYNSAGVVTAIQQLNAGTSQTLREQCNDFSGGPQPYPDSNLTIDKHGWRKHVYMNGFATYRKVPSQTQIDEFAGFTPPTARHFTAACPGLPSIDWGYWTTKALANINPNRPDVDLPVSIAELKDLPKMLKNIGDLLNIGRSRMSHDVVKTMAESHLSWNFGWAPLIQDLTDMLGFTDMVNERLDYLKKLDGGTIVQRRLGRLPPSSSTDRIAWTNDAHGALYYEFYQTTKFETEGWFTARAKLRYPLPPTDRERRDMAAAAALGLNLSPATAWNLIPWSWLSDWFTNTGDLLDLTRNAIPYSVSDMNVMVKTTGISHVAATKLPVGVRATMGEGLRVVKRRNVTTNPTPRFTFKPWITPGQGSILGSLAIVKALR